jgi:hypothetical protein
MTSNHLVTTAACRRHVMNSRRPDGKIRMESSSTLERRRRQAQTLTLGREHTEDDVGGRLRHRYGCYPVFHFCFTNLLNQIYDQKVLLWSHIFFRGHTARSPSEWNPVFKLASDTNLYT